MLKLIFSRVCRDNIMLITDSISASWQSDGDTSLGGLEVEIKDGNARLKSNGALAGSTLRYNHGLKLIHEITGEPLSEILATTSWNQAVSLGLPKAGKIEPGFHADLVVLEEDFEVSLTLVGGK